VVLNETLAKLRFGREDPVGKRVKGPDFGEPSESPGRKVDPESEVATVVGVIADLRYSKLDEEATPELYVPYAMTPGIYRLSVVIKTSGDPRAIVPSVRGAFSEIARTQTPFDIMPLDQSLSESIAPRRLNLLVLGTFAAAALVLALIGIYGVMSYSVSQRTHEIGVRSAVGATSRDIVRMIVWQGVRLAAIGVAAGIAGAQILTREMSSLLFDVKPTDPATFITAAGVLAVTALVASAVPAIKAGGVDPMVALRYE
jgi:putative ABC transport system permease protein